MSRTGALLLVAAATVAGSAIGGGRALELRRIDSGGQVRFYRLHVPPGYQPGAPAAVLLGFHGGGGNATGFADSTGLLETADAHGFLAVFPEGSGPFAPPLFTLQTWNAGNCCGYAMDHQVDDVGFVRDLLDDLARDYAIDLNRIYATGLSNGGMISYRLAVELGDRIAAAAPVAAALGVDAAPARPIPLLVFHGALDTNVPWQGGVGSGLSGTDFKSQAESLAPFLEVNQAQPAPAPLETIGSAQLYVAEAEATGADIHYWWLLDQGHSWPGKPAQLDPSELFNSDIDTNQEIWAFFATHPRRRVAAPVGTGCGSGVDPPALSSDLPLLGRSLELRGSGVEPGAQGVLYFSGVPGENVVLAPGCTAYLELESVVAVAALQAGAEGRWSIVLPIPYDLALDGMELRIQAVFHAESAPGFELTNGLQLRLGL
jgi:polyhydroxybutyrate depolymerase